MKKIIVLALAAAFAACSHSDEKRPDPAASTAPFSLDLSRKSELEIDGLRLVPVVASAAQLVDNQGLTRLLPLAEAMKMDGFRITELQNFGRDDDRGSVNSLTVANRLDRPVWLLQGDVLTGGKQDRTVAEEQAVAAASLRNIDVFCVEHGRWAVSAEATEQQKKQYAFTGYCNVASNDVRRVLQKNGSQQDVWASVGSVTERFGASSSTSTLNELSRNEAFSAKRDAILRFFEGKMDFENPNTVGFVLVLGDRILGGELFGRPELFRKQFKNILAAYATDAIGKTASGSASDESIQLFFSKLEKAARSGSSSEAARAFVLEGKTAHVSAVN